MIFMNENKIKGLRSIIVFIPTVIILSVLYIIILVATIFINKYTTTMYDESNKTNDCIEEVTIIQSSESLMAETSSVFVHEPLIQMGPSVTAINPALGAYKEELLDETRNIDYVMENLKDYDLSDEDYEKMEVCANAAKKMIVVQVHSFTLVYSIEEIQSVDSEQKILETILNNLDKYELTTEESNMTDSEKKNLAFELLQADEYSNYKSEISKNIREVVSSINKNNDKYQSDLIMDVKMMRGVLWGSILLILIANVIFFFILFRRLILPINRISNQIKDNKELDPKNSLYEVHYLAGEYNVLLSKRKEFEKELRIVAENDSLTGLPNRYCYNEYLKDASLDKKSVCVFLLDINNLKYINDKFGHAQGDELIKNASICIKDCFLDETGKNCFRIGGDEFVAILYDVKESEIEELLNKFNKLQKEKDVSIALGYAYSSDIKSIGYERLIMQADDNMYKDKQNYKKLSV